MSSSGCSETIAVCHRKTLRIVVGALLNEIGFGTAEKMATETLTEMLQSYITELGRSTRAFCELSGRTEVMLSDVFMAMVEMGLDTQHIATHARRPNKTVFVPPTITAPPPITKALTVGERQARPAYVPEYLPLFPDPHTYIRTLTHRPPVTEYQAMREKAATQKRDVERALTRFIAKTGNTVSLFDEANPTFPLVAVTPCPMPYLDALLPKDQDLDSQEPTMDVNSAAGQRAIHGPSVSDMDSSLDQLQTLEAADPDAIDNPYMRPPKQPPKRRK